MNQSVRSVLRHLDKEHDTGLVIELDIGLGI